MAIPKDIRDKLGLRKGIATGDHDFDVVADLVEIDWLNLPLVLPVLVLPFVAQLP